MVAPIEQRFNAAVNVIRGLPKHGSYQPSNDMLLRFYAYFKQATLGPCKQQRPAFWNVVDKAKWDAYNNLGQMPAERAMELYVDELKKIIETMSYTDNVAEFMGSIGELGAVDIGDLEAVAPEAIKQVRSRPNSPFASRDTSPVRTLDEMAAAMAVHDAVGQLLADATNGGANGHGDDADDDGPLLVDDDEDDDADAAGRVRYANGATSGAAFVSDQSEDDEYIDTVEDDTILHNDNISHRYSRSNSRRMDNYRLDLDPHDPHRSNGDHRQSSSHNHLNNGASVHRLDASAAAAGCSGHHNAGVNGTNGSSGTSGTVHVVSANVEPALNQMLRCVEAMRVDLQQINNRINIVERSLGDVRSQQYQLQHQSHQQQQRGGGGKQTVAGGAHSTLALIQRYSPVWWPFGGITPAWFVVLAVVWPLVARRLVRAAWSSRRRS